MDQADLTGSNAMTGYDPRTAPGCGNVRFAALRFGALLLSAEPVARNPCRRLKRTKPLFGTRRGITRLPFTTRLSYPARPPTSFGLGGLW
jgi:hypothetical protein